MPEQPKDPTIGKDGKCYPLTAKQLKFIDRYLETDNASEAYRQVYGCKGWSDRAVHVKASDSLNNPKIATEIALKRSKAAAKVMVTVESLVAELDEAREIALAEKSSTGMSAATLGKAKLLGFMVDKVDQTVRQAKPSDHRPDLQGIRQRITDSVTEDATKH